MMKNLLFILACLVVLGSCKEDEAPENKLIGTWRFVKGADFYDGGNSTPLELTTDCQRESFVKFVDNGTYRCRDVCSSEYTYEGKYEMQEDHKTLKLSKSWFVIWPEKLLTMSSIRIVTLTEDKLVLEMVGGHSDGSWCEYRRE